MTKLDLALLGTLEATYRLRDMKMIANATPATAAQGHMPFPGHRTVATVWAQQAAARKRERELRPLLKAMEYGLDPDSLKASAK